MTQRFGIKYPVQKDSRQGFFQASEDLKSVAKSNLLSLLHTDKGERLMHPDMGCDLRKMLFDPFTPTLKTRIKENIIGQVNKWLDYISIDEIVSTESSDGHGIKVRIKFSLKNLGDESDILETIIE